MLTKEERAAIAERTRSFNGNSLCYSDIYRCLFGVEVPGDTSFEEDSKALVTRILDLCDTSNMIELPVDKDGEVIRAGDTVYDKDGDVATVSGYYHNNDNWKIIVPYGRNDCFINVFPNELTHKKPVTIASITERIREIASNDDDISYCTSSELVRIAEQLESLGDSDD